MVLEKTSVGLVAPILTREASQILGIQDKTKDTPFTFEDFAENFSENTQDSRQIYDSYIKLVGFAENGELNEVGAIKGLTQITGENEYKFKLWKNNIQDDSWRYELWNTLKSDAGNFIKTFPAVFKTFLSDCSKWSENVIRSQPNGFYKNILLRPFYTLVAFAGFSGEGLLEAGSAIYNSSSEAIVTADAQVTAHALFGSGMLALQLALLKKGASVGGSTTEIGNAASIVVNADGTAALAPSMALDLSAQSALIPTSFAMSYKQDRYVLDNAYPKTEPFKIRQRDSRPPKPNSKHRISKRVISQSIDEKLAALGNRLKDKRLLSKHEIVNLKQIAFNEAEAPAVIIMALRVLKAQGEFRSKFISDSLLARIAPETNPDIVYQTHLLLRDIPGHSAIKKMYNLQTALLERISKVKGPNGKALRKDFEKVFRKIRVDINRRTIQFALKNQTNANGGYLVESVYVYMNPKTGIIESVSLKNGSSFNLTPKPDLFSLNRVALDFDWRTGTVEKVVASDPINTFYLGGYKGVVYATRSSTKEPWTYPIRNLFNN